MKIDIWSDIMCPFCYIGKRKLETALNDFSGKEHVEIIWHSFQLDPYIAHQPGKDLYSYLSERKGISIEHSMQLHDQLAESARQNGLEYNFDKAVIANSFDAHRLIQLAKTYNLGDAAEERIFRAYFTEGKNISDSLTLAELGVEIGLDKDEVIQMLNSDAFSKEVKNDITRATEFGIRGVPFFILNGKYAISGAQPVETFQSAIRLSYSEWEKENGLIEVTGENKSVCSTEGNCD
ncbi:MAG: DsbA family oxidoreductase [Chitinophagaceae bacterium]